MGAKLRFTKRALDALAVPPEGTRAYYHDSSTRGLCLAVMPTGAKIFYLYRKVAGQPLRLKIGPYPDLSIENARDKADELNTLIAKGKDPREALGARRGELTVGRLFDEYIARHVEPYRKPRTKAEYENQNRLHLAPWRNTKLTGITRRRVQELHGKIGRESGPYIANRVLSLLSAMFAKASAWGYWQGDNPARGIPRFKEQSRERFLHKGELPRFWLALSEEPNETARDCITLCLLTGARRSNVQAMHWREIDFEEATWRIPDTKGGSPQTVPLAPLAVATLKERKKATPFGEWVFPAPSKSGHVEEIRFAWQRILERAGIADLRLHDLRRTLGSYQAAQGSSLHIIGKSLGHKSSAATRIYSQLDLDPVRASVEAAVEGIVEATRAPQSGQVVALPKAGR